MLQRLKKLPVNRTIDVLMLVFLATFPLYQKTYWIYVMSGIMAYMMFALSLDLLWGYTGLMSMGHSVLFGAGGYMVGIGCAYINQANWIKFDNLPWFLSLLGTDAGAFLMALLVPGIIAFFIGIFMFTGKIQGVFFSLITLAIAGIAELFVKNQSLYTHGDSGITVISRTVISNVKAMRMTDFQYYYVVLAFLLAAYFICLLLINSRTGKVLQSVRENEARLTFLGYRPAIFKLFVFVVSGMMAGLAGVLYVRVQGSINYTAVGITTSTIVLVWVAVGGRGNLTGAMLGALLLQIAETKLNSAFSGISADFAQYWKLALGILILVIVFVIPKGIVGTLIEAQQKRRDSARRERILAREEVRRHA